MYKSYSMELSRKNTDCRYRTCSKTGQWCCILCTMVILQSYATATASERAERRDRFLPVKQLSMRRRCMP